MSDNSSQGALASMFSTIGRWISLPDITGIINRFLTFTEYTIDRIQTSNGKVVVYVIAGGIVVGVLYWYGCLMESAMTFALTLVKLVFNRQATSA